LRDLKVLLVANAWRVHRRQRLHLKYFLVGRLRGRVAHYAGHQDSKAFLHDILHLLRTMTPVRAAAYGVRARKA
jgi:hypothetical protein